MTTQQLEHHSLIDAVASNDWTPMNVPEVVSVLRALSEVLNKVVDSVNVLERRNADLEARLSTSTDWMPDPDDLAEQFLWLRSRCDGGPDIGERDDVEPWGPVTGLSMEDMANRALRPKTWAQLTDCMQMIAQDVVVLVNRADGHHGDLPPADNEDMERLAEVLAAAKAKHREELLTEAARLRAFADEIDKHGEEAIKAGPSASH